MVDPFKVIGGTGGDGGGGRAAVRALLIPFLQPPPPPRLYRPVPSALIAGDYHLMPPRGRQFRKTGRCRRSPPSPLPSAVRDVEIGKG